MRIQFLFLLLILIQPRSSFAELFNLKVIDYGGIENFPAFKGVVDTQLQKIENEINDNLPSGAPKEIMEGMANSSVMAAKGVGSDYSSNMEVFLFGAGLGVGADLTKVKETNSEIRGVGVAPGLIIGANLGKLGIDKFAGLDAKRLNTYVNFINYGITQETSNSRGIEGKASLNNTNVGVHFRYQLKEGNDNKIFGYGGIKLHWGYEYNNTDMRFESDINRVVTVNNTDGVINGKIVGKPKYGINTQTHSIPLEISSDIRLLYFLSFYGGLGTDINYGKAKGSGLLNADVSPLICTEGAVCAGGKLIQVQVQANLDATGRVDPLMLRGFAGLQFNVPYVRIFGQVDKAFGTNLYSATAGLRFVF